MKNSHFRSTGKHALKNLQKCQNIVDEVVNKVSKEKEFIL
jgi:hypothetical protein